MRKKILPAIAWALALAFLLGVLVYYNFFSGRKTSSELTYTLAVDSPNGTTGPLSFSIQELGGGSHDHMVIPKSGSGTAADPYELTNIYGQYDIVLAAEETQYFTYTVKKTAVTCELIHNENVRVRVFFVQGGVQVAVYDSRLYDTNVFTLEPTPTGGGELNGNKVGDVCYDFSLPLYTEGGELALSSLRGKIVIVNFWGTWCGPCVTELPAFARIADEYAGRVEVVAVHSGFMPTDVQNYIDTKEDVNDPTRTWRDWKVHFVQDIGDGFDSEIYALLGGKNGTYPRTLILNEDGMIVDIPAGSVKYEYLKTWVETLLAE